MSNTKNNGGPAFPRQHDWGYGMTLRDYFAAKAMEGMMMGCVGTIGLWPEISAYANGPHNVAIADRAYAIADAMLKAREQ